LLGKFLIVIIFILNSTAALQSEIIRVSLLKPANREFTIGRDIFSPLKLNPDVSSREIEPVIEKIEEPVEEEGRNESAVEKMEAEMQQSISFEGYVIKSKRNHALLSINGEFFIAAEDDVVLEKIKIVKIEKTELTVEVDAKTFKINLKGDDEDDV
jgi:hypothetical protein